MTYSELTAAVLRRARTVRDDAEVIGLHQCHGNNPHLAIVTISSASRFKQDDGAKEYITWTYNIQSDGLSHGSYGQTYDGAMTEQGRRSRLYDRSDA